MDLYNDLEELQGMTRLLIDDVSRLRPRIGEGNPDPSDDENAYRRFYVRAVFALVEAFVEQHRRLVVHLCEAGKIDLRENKLGQLRETRQILDSDGAVLGEEPNYMGIFEKIKEVYKAAAAGFGSQLRITFGDDHWREFKTAMEIRNQITHPKTIQDCWIFEPSLQLVIAANEWFKALQNDFVRMARTPRAESRTAISVVTARLRINKHSSRKRHPFKRANRKVASELSTDASVCLRQCSSNHVCARYLRCPSRTVTGWSALRS